MRIRRTRLTRDFLQVPNATARDSRLSHMARGVLVDLLSRPDGWETTADDMWRESVKRHGKESPGRRQFRAAFAELKTHGYLTAERALLEGGKHGTVLTVRDVPALVPEVPHAGTPVPPGETGITAGRADVPHGGTSARPAETCETAGQPDVPASGTSAAPAETEETAGRTDVPHAGTSYRKRSVKKTGNEKTGVGADAVGKGAGGFARAGGGDSAGDESAPVDGGFAASDTTTSPSSQQTSPRPALTRTRPRTEHPGFALVRAAIPAEVAKPGSTLFPGLVRAINDLLTGAPGANIPARTPEQVIARVNRRWFSENADTRSAPGYRGCDRCTASGCDAARRSPDNPEGCDRIKSRSAWLAAAILTQDCSDARCEDGQLIDGGPCLDCQQRYEEHRQAKQAAEEASARMRAHIDAQAEARAARAADTAWSQAETAQEHRIRATLGAAGVYGVKLEHQVHQHMTGWRDRNPKPQVTRNTEDRREAPQAPVQGAFLMPLPTGDGAAAAAPHTVTQRSSHRQPPLENCDGCDKGHRPTTPGTLCPVCRVQQRAVSNA